MSDSAGRLEADEFVLPARVYYADTDAGGVVYHSKYLDFAERARTECLRALGISLTKLADESGIIFAVRHATLDYKAPAKLDDLLEIRTRLRKIGGASLELEQAVTRSGVVLVNVLITLVTINGAGRPVRIPAEVRQGFSAVFPCEV